MADLIDLQYLKSIIHYDASIGLFTRIAKSGPNAVVGPITGHHHSGYQFIRVKGKKYAARRLAWFYVNGKWPDDTIDHINGEKSDNRIDNLRQASRKHNNFNRQRYRNNTSGFKGVTWHKASRKWMARVYANRQVYELGCFNSKIEAANAYNNAATSVHGRFAKLNWQTP